MIGRRRFLNTIARGIFLSTVAPRVFGESLSTLTDTHSSNLRWLQIPSPHLEVNGLPWFAENGGELSRLPVKLKESFRKPVWNLAQDPSGGRIRFRTNSTSLAVRLEYPHGPSMTNMQAFGQTGVDLYVNKNTYWGTAIAGRDSKPGLVQNHSFYEAQRGVDREITLYLPLYAPVKVLGIGVDADAKIYEPRSFALNKPIVFYGTSITQGGCASRSGMSYEAILGRSLNVDFINLGFSGNGIGEPEMAGVVASLDPAAFVLDFAHNNPTVESLKQAYDPFIAAIRREHSQTPIILMTPIYDAHLECWAPRPLLDEMRTLIRQVAAQRIAAGDKNLQLVEGTDLLGPSQGDSLVDGVHPNDLGQKAIAEGLVPRISKIIASEPIV
ncbi:SGNH/GDSL hydrolase family protein [Edaphobacter sp. HDX4]|uniref:SGNH/GDSL hydrolase family protein n=1 Tax=Edaphobacter sp. HDX4 TaxID=2794064 RepID=UPI002FE63DF0